MDLSLINNIDDVLEHLEDLTDDDLVKLREMGVYEPLSVEDPDIDEIITDKDIESDLGNIPMPEGWK
ncbi:MAG: hypothetical protein J6Y24_11280 [Bacteroidales bacterium]|nr:hypothetical protein [Bacteroidales bacterium]